MTTSALVSDRQRPLYFRDSYLRSTQAVVKRCEKQTRPTQSGGQLWSVILSESPLYPEGGGQPYDEGIITWDDQEVLEKARVLDVQREDGGSIAHYITRPVPRGCHVTVEVDWSRRYDFMQQHTGQHLISAVIYNLYGADTVSWELHQKKAIGLLKSNAVHIDVNLLSATPEMIKAIEDKCNEIVRSAIPVTARFTDNQDPFLASSALRGVVPTKRKDRDEIRLICIAGIDVNACGGTHLQSTSELQGFKIVSLEAKAGIIRLGYLAGGRLLDAFASSLSTEEALNKALSCGPADYLAKIGKFQVEQKALKVQGTALAVQLGTYIALEGLARGCIHHHQPYADSRLLLSIAKEASKKAPGAVFLLTGSDAEPASLGLALPGPFVLVGPSDLIRELGPLVAKELHGRGGGKSGIFQGKAANVGEAKQALQLAKGILSNM